MNYFKTIRFGLLLILFILFIGLTFLSFTMVISAEEGGHAGSSSTLGEAAFDFFSFPMHRLFHIKAGETLYFWGFIINSLFYAFIVERIFYFIKRKEVSRKPSRW